jgi:hypothetical protein
LYSESLNQCCSADAVFVAIDAKAPSPH